jgi:Protein phosphatase 2C
MQQAHTLPWKIIAGSVPGTSHTALMKNNQDAMRWYQDDHILIAICCDGSSVSNDKNTPYFSEIGSHILSNIALKTIKDIIYAHGYAALTWSDFWDRLSIEILAQIKITCSLMDSDIHLIARTYFQSTLMGYIITPTDTYVFGCGDGVYGINGEITTILPPTQDNYPPYLIYALIGSSVYATDSTHLRIQLHRQIPTETVQHIFIGTDGVTDLINAESVHIPGQQDHVGPLSSIWTLPAYQKNPFWLQNRLTLYNTARSKKDRNGDLQHHKGLLPDDTTLLVTFKNPEHENNTH